MKKKNDQTEPLLSRHSPGLSTAAAVGPDPRCSWGSLSHQSRRVWRNGQSQKPAAPKSFHPALHTGSGEIHLHFEAGKAAQQSVSQSVSPNKNTQGEMDVRLPAGISKGSWYLKDERLVENGTEILALYFGLVLFLFVWQQKDFDVGVRGPPHVHSSQVLSLKDPHDQLQDTKGLVIFMAADAWLFKCCLT